MVQEINDEELAQLRALAIHYFDNAVMKRVLARLDRLTTELAYFKEPISTGTSMTEITDEQLAKLKRGFHPCLRCKFCNEGQDERCQDGEGLTEIERGLVERLERAEAEGAKLKGSIRMHRDQRGDDRCYLDDAQLYEVLGEGSAVTSLPPKETFLANCARFHASRQKPGEKYETEADRHKGLKELVTSLATLLKKEFPALPVDADDLLHFVKVGGFDFRNPDKGLFMSGD